MNVNRAVLFVGCFSIGVIAGLRSLTARAPDNRSVAFAALMKQGGNTAPLLRAGCPQSFREDRPKVFNKIVSIAMHLE